MEHQAAKREAIFQITEDFLDMRHAFFGASGKNNFFNAVSREELRDVRGGHKYIIAAPNSALHHGRKKLAVSVGRRVGNRQHMLRASGSRIQNANIGVAVVAKGYGVARQYAHDTGGLQLRIGEQMVSSAVDSFNS